MDETYTILLTSYSPEIPDLMKDVDGLLWDTIGCQADDCCWYDDYLAGQGQPPSGSPGPASYIADTGSLAFLLCSSCADGDWFYHQRKKYVRSNDGWEPTNDTD